MMQGQANPQKEISSLIKEISTKIQSLYMRGPPFFERKKVEILQEKFLDLQKQNRLHQIDQIHLQKELNQIKQDLLKVEQILNKRDFFHFTLH